eukprot:4886369-Heterocapsa_arctica.AAC.1
MAGRDPEWLGAASRGPGTEGAARAGTRAAGVRTAKAPLLALDASAPNMSEDSKAGTCHDPDADLCAQQMGQWLT